MSVLTLTKFNTRTTTMTMRYQPLTAFILFAIPAMVSLPLFVL